jgi:uncharacterized RDD family membrane protein YckC
MIDLVVLVVIAAIANAWFAVQFWRDIEPAVTVYFSAMFNPDAKPEDFNVSTSDRAYYLIVTMFVVFTLLWFAYEVPSTANSGRTLGKRLMGIQVIPMEGPGRLTMGRSIRRWNPMGITPMLVLLCGILFIFALLLPFFDNLLVVTDRYLHQALHDRSARTYVVTAPKKEVES